MDRRDVLRAAAACLALASTGIARQVAPSNKPRKRAFKKCLKFEMLESEGTLMEKFGLLKDLGFDGVELESPSGLDADEVIDARDATGLLIPGVIGSARWAAKFGDPDPEVRAVGRLGLETAISDCKLFGGETVSLIPAVVSKDIAYDAAWERSQLEISKVLPHAQRMGIKLAFENGWSHFLLSPLEAARYVDAFNSDAVGWHLDIGNVVNYGWPEQWARILAHRVLRVDIKDFSRGRRNSEGLWKGFDVKLGDGDCDWAAVMDALDEMEYSGWASAEVQGGGDERVREIVERMDSIFAS